MSKSPFFTSSPSLTIGVPDEAATLTITPSALATTSVGFSLSTYCVFGIVSTIFTTTPVPFISTAIHAMSLYSIISFSPTSYKSTPCFIFPGAIPFSAHDLIISSALSLSLPFTLTVHINDDIMYIETEKSNIPAIYAFFEEQCLIKTGSPYSPFISKRQPVFIPHSFKSSAFFTDAFIITIFFSCITSHINIPLFTAIFINRSTENPVTYMITYPLI